LFGGSFGAIEGSGVELSVFGGGAGFFGEADEGDEAGAVGEGVFRPLRGKLPKL
jgi:hypothetical protein